MDDYKFKATPGAVDGFLTEPFQKKKDAMLSDFYSSTNRMPKKAFEEKRKEIKAADRMEKMEEVPKTKGKRVYPTGRGR